MFFTMFFKVPKRLLKVPKRGPGFFDRNRLFKLGKPRRPLGPGPMPLLYLRKTGPGANLELGGNRDLFLEVWVKVTAELIT